MSTQQSTVDFILDQLGSLPVHARKMFGEYALYCDSKVVALVCDDQLYVKITEISPKYLDRSHEAPPYPSAKNALNVPEEKWDDREWMQDFIRETTELVPTPKPKKKR